MRSKGRQGKYSLLLLFVGIFAFWWGVAVLAQNNNPASASVQTIGTSAGAAVQNIEGPVAVQEAVSNSNVYTYSGSIPLTDSCEQLATGIAVSGSSPAHVTIVLTLSKPFTACAEASNNTPEDQPFAVSLSMPTGTKALLDGLTVNGVIVATNLTKTASAQ